ncbi:MAG TPA: TIGR03621 family F420-dependent LLM class oxidoreductase [Polyangiales bacterium]|nr:TIGR03621 family F420-dependent LLM class oxidoreductase [Polyangiales bacterium]
MPRPFRFGIQAFNLPPARWSDELREIEALGYSSVYFPDHFGPQWDPLTGAMAAAAVTERLRVGTLVCDVDYRHPVVLAKSAATIQLASAGRLELGIGAGWMQSDYDQAGIAYDSHGTRIERLEEALQILRGMWHDAETSFSGRHYRITKIGKAIEPLPERPPAILIGGGRPKILGVAGRYADTVGINPSLHEGRVTRDTARDLTHEAVQRKVGWVREAAEAAGRSFDAIELSTLTFVVAVTDDPKPLRDMIAQNTGLSSDEIIGCPLFLTGSASEIRDTLQRRREQTGISHVVIQHRDLATTRQFAESIVRELAGK